MGNVSVRKVGENRKVTSSIFLNNSDGTKRLGITTKFLLLLKKTCEVRPNHPVAMKSSHVDIEESGSRNSFKLDLPLSLFLEPPGKKKRTSDRMSSSFKKDQYC